MNPTSAPPIPTPYDITTVPYIPYTPSWLAWVALVITVGLGGCLTIWITRRRNPPSHSPSDAVLQELSSIENAGSGAFLSRQECVAASLIVRRALDASYHLGVHAMGSNQLRDLATSHPHESIRDIATILAELDTAKFLIGEESTISRSQLGALRVLFVVLRHQTISDQPPAIGDVAQQNERRLSQ